MVSTNIVYYCGRQAIERLIDYCEQANFRRFNLICDTRTAKILGERVENLFKQQGWSVRRIELQGEEVLADETYLSQALAQSELPPSTYLAVGSGTITDITRWVSYQKGAPFISIPTAPSVDGFASVVAPVVFNGFKDTFPAQAPIAIFADIETLCRAPKAMIAAGFGDMLGKYTSLADWKLDHLIWGEDYRPEIAARIAVALQTCVNNLGGIRQFTPEGIAGLMNGLVESGLCMLENGNSRPASGAEHHLSHFWEMKLLSTGRPAVLHGVKVGVGCVLVAGLWEQVKTLKSEDVKRRLSDARLPDYTLERNLIDTIYRPNTERILKGQSRFLSLDEKGFANLKQSISDQWEAILEIAAGVPPASRIVDLLSQLDAPTHATEITLDTQEQIEALRYAHYLRDQFTISKLGRILGLWE